MDTLKPKTMTAVKIAASIEQRIRLGQWQPGFKLPTVRSLSKELKVNPSTVSTAYKLLRDSGVIFTDGRRGTFVQEDIDIKHTEMVVPKGLVDLASGGVDGTLLPKLEADWLAEYNLHCGDKELGDNVQLQELIKDCIRVDREPVLFSSTMDIIERALAQRCIPGAKVIVENPCWVPILPLLKSMRLEAVPIQMDDEGIIIPNDDVLASASALIITARAQNPTGICYSLERWQKLGESLADKNALLIIDDYWAALSSSPILPLDCLSSEWIYSTSTSKFLGPNFRLAVAIGNGSTIRSMKNRFALGPRWISGLVQYMAMKSWEKLIHSGSFELIRNSYATRRAALIRELTNHGVNTHMNGEGIHIWIPVENEVYTVQALASFGWAVQAGTPFSLDKKPAIRVSISNVSEEECSLLAKNIANVLHSPKRTIY